MGYAYAFISGVLGQWRSWYNCSTLGYISVSL